MKYLIDTQILIWYQLDSGKLSQRSADLLLDKSKQIIVSQISLLELAVKQKIGKLPELDIAVNSLVELIKQDGFEITNIKDEHIAAYAEIPLNPAHRDPFDRLLLATAFYENIPLISADEKFRNYRSVVQIVEN